MTNAINDLSTNAQLSMAAYGSFDPDMNVDTERYFLALIDAENGPGMSEAQAKAFIGLRADGTRDPADPNKGFEIVHHEPNDGSGFSATVFRDRKSGKYHFAIRGTEQFVLDLVLADLVQIGLTGAAVAQIVAMYNYYQRLIAPEGPGQQVTQIQSLVDPNEGEIQFVATEVAGIGLGIDQIDETTIFDVTGHSLGGHLAAAFSFIFSSNTSAAHVYNAPGFTATPLVQDLFAALGSAIPSSSSLIQKIIADKGLEIVPATGTLPGTEQRVFIEEQTSPLGNHRIRTLADSLAVYDLLAKIDPDIDIDVGRDILESASNVAAPSLENIVNALGDLFRKGTPISGTDDRQQLYARIIEIRDDIEGKGNSFSVDINQLAGLSEGDLVTNAKASIAFRYALTRLNPFVIEGDDSIYAPFQGELELENFSKQFLEDRAHVLSQFLIRNKVDSGVVLGSGFNNEFYKDIATGTSTSTSDAFTPATATQFIFGDDGLNQITGGIEGDHLYGGGGVDFIDGLGADDYIEGNDGADVLNGGLGNDRLVGGKGFDQLFGEDGDDKLYGASLDSEDPENIVKDDIKDILSGGAGFDEYFVGKDDVIIDDSDGEGKVTFNDVALSGGPQIADGLWQSDQFLFRQDGRHLIVENTDTGDSIKILAFDFENGYLGINLEDEKMTVAPVVGGAGDDILNGGGLDDEISGGPGRDVLSDGGGDDLLDGGPGNDVLGGGPGKDILIGGDGDDVLHGDGQISAGEGWSVEFVGESPFAEVVFTGLAVLTPFLDEFDSDVYFGGPGNDFLFDDGGNDAMFGEEGNDSLSGGMGDDFLDGGSGNDLIFADFVSDFAGDPDVDILNALNMGKDTLLGGDGDDELHGGNSDDLILGGSGDDTLFGDFDGFPEFAGDDRLFGGEGDDELHGGPGDDLLDGGDGVDLVFGEEGDDTLAGGAGDDDLRGGEGRDTLSGGDGDDLLFGQAGDDVLEGDAGDDELQGGAGVDTLAGGTGNDVLAGQEGDDSLEGNAGNDELQGGEGIDTLSGGAGNDILFGMDGDDVLDGGAGDDQLVGGPGADSITGGSGTDRIFRDDDDTVVFRPGDDNDTVSFSNGGTLVLDGVAQGQFQISQRIFGDGQQYLIIDYGTGDSLAIERGFLASGQIFKVGDKEISHKDFIQQNAPALTLVGTDGNDTMFGGSQADTLFGNLGNDIIEGGQGDDELDGGLGNDTYVFNLGDGKDAITDFDPNVSNIDTIRFGNGITDADIQIEGVNNDLVISINNGTDSITIIDWFDPQGANEIERLAFADGTTIDLAALAEPVRIEVDGDGNQTIQGTIRDDELIGGTGNDLLFGKTGDDILRGNSGNDILNGQEGDDLLDGGTGNDQLIGGTGDDTILFSRGDGQDTVIINSDVPDETDTIQFAPDISPDDVSVRANGSDLLLFIDGTSDRLKIENWFGSSEPSVKRIQFDDGTLWDVPTLLALFTTPSEGNDTLVGTPGDDTIDGGGGNDTVFGRDGDDTLYGSDGSDSLHGEGGNDFLDGGAQPDSLFGGDGDDILVGGANERDQAPDRLMGGPGEDTLDGGPDFDILEGGTGADTYVISRGAGWNNITELDAEENVMLFGEGIAPEGLTIHSGPGESELVNEGVHGGEVAIGIGNDEGAVITAPPRQDPDTGIWLLNIEDVRVKRFRFADGTELTLEDILQMRSEGIVGFQGGTIGDDVLIGSVGQDQLFGGAGNDWIIARDNDDDIRGGTGDDVISGGLGFDDILGGPGNDIIAAGPGDETYSDQGGSDVFAFNRGDGHDFLGNSSQSPGEDIDTFSFGGGITPGEISAFIDATGELNLLVDDGDQDSIRIGSSGTVSHPIARAQFIDENGTRIFDLVGTVAALSSELLAADADNPVALFTDATAGFELTGTVAPAGGEFAEAYAKTGDLFLTGEELVQDDGDDVLDGTAGNDTIDVGGGTNVVNAGAGNDTITSSGNDTIRAGSGNDLLIISGDSRSLVLGGSGNDTFIINAPGLPSQSGANGIFIGGTGNDTYNYNRGSSRSRVQIVDLAGPDQGNTLRFGPGISSNSLRLSIGSLLIKFDGSDDEISLANLDPNNVLGPRAIETFEFDDGSILSYAELIARGFDIDGTDENDALTGTNVVDRILGRGGDDTLTANDGDDTLVGGAGDDQMDGGAGNDTYVINLGDGSDSISDASGIDEVTFGAGITIDGLVVTQDGGNLVVAYRAEDQLTISDWFVGDQANQIEQFVFSDGTVLSAAEIEALIGAGQNQVPIVSMPIADQSTDEDSAFSFQIPAGTFTDPDAGDTLTFSTTLSDGSTLPAWLGFDASTQTFSGTPANDDVGDLAVRVVATDSAGESVFDEFVLTVQNVNDAPGLANPLADQGVDEDTAFTFQVPTNTFTDDDTIHGDSLNLSATLTGGAALPLWLGFDAMSGTFSGTPVNADVGSIDIAVTATDTQGVSVNDTFILTVNNINDAPVLATPLDDQSVLEFEGFSFQIPANSFTDDDAIHGDSLTLSATRADGSALPAWLTFDPVTGIFSGTPDRDDLGDLNIVVIATDQSGATTSDDFTLTVDVTPAVIVGTDGNDRIVGTSNDDIILGLAGKDVIHGKAGNDLILGGEGNDILKGQAGDDRLEGGAGHDLLLGGSGDDHLDAGDGHNVLVGGLGHDTLTAGSGNDVLLGGPGDDHLDAGDGYNIVIGGLGDDTLLASAGNDKLIGGHGDDTLNGGTGNDTLKGGKGSDTLQGGPGDDVINTGKGHDTILFDRGDGRDRVTGGRHNRRDTVLFAPDIDPDELWFRRDGEDLNVHLLGTDDQITFEDWYRGDKFRIGELHTDAGAELAARQVDLLVQAMAAFVTNSGSDSLPPEMPEDLNAVITAAWDMGS